MRCGDADVISYTATASNAAGIGYSIFSSGGVGTAPTIDPVTGAVTYAADWRGTSVITASAAGCGTPTSASFTVNTVAVRAVDDADTGLIGEPIVIDVTENDLCGYNTASLSITDAPENGTVQIGIGGALTYLPNGSYLGADQFVYQICTGATPGSGTCSQATVSVTVLDDGENVCAAVNEPHTYYMPFPENIQHAKKALKSASSSSSHTTTSRSLITICTNNPNAIIYYDQWEDGYEATAGTKTQTSTLIWGDGNLTNGVAPGFDNDTLPEGAVITLDNTFTDRAAADTGLTTLATQYYDGRDKIYSNVALSIVKVTADGGISGTNPLFNLQSFKTNVVDVTKFGNLFVIPFGENIVGLNNPTITRTHAFNYVGLFVRASEDGTILTLDVKGDGTVMRTSPTLAEGQVWFYDGYEAVPGTPPAAYLGTPANKNGATDIKSGAILTSNNPVGVDMVFGDLYNFGTRNIALFPSKFYGSTYYSPVHDPSGTTNPTYAIFSNSLADAMTISWQNGSGENGTLVLPAKGYNSMRLSAQSGYKFSQANGKNFTAVTVVDVETAATSGAPTGTYDWAFNMIPEHQLSNFVGTAWAPGSSTGVGNYHPVWITAPQATTVYVKFDGKITGTTGYESTCGLRYDTAFSATALQALKIYNPSGDQTGMSVYTYDGTEIAGAWGAYPATGLTPAGAPALDVGYVLEPLCMNQIILANNDTDTTFPNIPVTVPVLNNDLGALDIGTVAITTPPSSGSVVINPDGTITYTPNIGYTGTEVFNYQVCNTSTPSRCDTAQVTIYINCVTQTGKHYITGRIFSDVDADGIFDGAEVGVAHAVNLYGDANGNSVLDVGEVLLQTVQADSIGAYIFERASSVGTTSYIVQLQSPLPANKTITAPDPATFYAVSLTGAGSSCNRDFGLAEQVFIAGFVWNDANGMTDNTVNGEPYSSPMYVVLVDTATGLVIGSQLVNPADGSYSFTAADGVQPNGDYILYLSETAPATGSSVGTTPVAGLPGDGWLSTGENIGAGSGNDGLANSVIQVSPGLTPAENVNFGIQQPPFAGEGFHNAYNPGGTVHVTVPPTSFSNTEGSSDANPGGVTSIRFTTFPEGATTVTIDGVDYDGSDPDDVAAFTSLIIPTNSNGEPVWVISVDPTDSDNTTVVFDFKSIDSAGAESSNDGIVTVNLTTPGITGTVFEDTDGATIIDGTATNGGSALFVNVLNAANEVVHVALVGVDCNGSPAVGAFCIQPGVLETGSYTLQLTENMGTVGDAAPSTSLGTWSSVGEGLADGGNDGTADGLFEIELGNSPIDDVRFGITDEPMPVTLLSFTAQKAGATSQLNWTTAMEQNNKGFFVQRSANGAVWAELEFVNSKAPQGNSNGQIDYLYFDKAPLNGKNFYRLKQVDIDGKFEYSTVRIVNFAQEQNINIYPNPTDNQLTVTGLQEGAAILVYDAVGRMVKQQKANAATANVDVQHLAEGDYQMRIISVSGVITTIKFAKLK